EHGLFGYSNGLRFAKWQCISHTADFWCGCGASFAFLVGSTVDRYDRAAYREALQRPYMESLGASAALYFGRCHIYGYRHCIDAQCRYANFSFASVAYRCRDADDYGCVYQCDDGTLSRTDSG